MSELYAQKLDISDDRVKESSIAEAAFGVKAYAESAVFFPADAGVRIADKQVDLKEALEAGKITEEQYKKSVSELREMSVVELEKREQEATAVKEDAGKTADERAAAEIIEEISKKRKEERSSSGKYYALSYIEHMVRATKIKLVVRDASLDKEKELELDKRTKAVKELNEAFLTKYSNTKTFADRMLSISGDVSAKKLAAPAEQNKNFVYEGK